MLKQAGETRRFASEAIADFCYTNRFMAEPGLLAETVSFIY